MCCIFSPTNLILLTYPQLGLQTGSSFLDKTIETNPLKNYYCFVMDYQGGCQLSGITTSVYVKSYAKPFKTHKHIGCCGHGEPFSSQKIKPENTSQIGGCEGS